MAIIRYIQEKIAQRKRVKKAMTLLAASGAIRHAGHEIRWSMGKRELEKFLTEKDEQA